MNLYTNKGLLLTTQISRDELPNYVGRKLFATYRDELVDVQISFIPTYVLADVRGILYIGTKNDMVGTIKGYHDVRYLTGIEQIVSKCLFNIHEKRRDYL